MKIKKSHLKELIKLSIAEAIWEQGQEEKEKKQPPAPPEKDKDDAKLHMSNPKDNPFEKDDIEEIEFKDKKAFQKYKAKHKMRGTTKVKIAGKETTVDKAAGKKVKKGTPKDKKKEKGGDDAGGPSYANVPKGAKTSNQARQMKQVDDLNKQAEKGDGAQIDTEKYGSVTWDSGDAGEKSFFAIGQDGEEIEVDYKDIVRFQGDKGDKILKNIQGGGDDVEKGKKKDTGKKSKIEKDMEKAVNDANEKMAWDSVPNIRKVQITNAEPAYIRHDHIAKTHKALEKAGSNKADAFKSLGDKYIKTKEESVAKYKELKDKDPKAAKKAFYDGISNYTKIGIEMQKLFGYDADEIYKNVYESKTRRFTVKEVHKWMKTLEENRYKKVYNADARRVSWMVNNEGVDLQEMPKSMRKKWTKAAYGRERYLAKEFLKSQKVMESLKRMIRQVVTEEIRHTNARFLYVPKNEIKKVKTILKRGIQKGKVEVDTKPSSKVGGHWRITVEKQKFDDIVEALMMKRIKVKSFSGGKM